MLKKVKPGPGQESVWDYPRPPRLEAFKGHLRIVLGGNVILDSARSVRMLETSHPPTYYIPVDDFIECVLIETEGSSLCEWKGMAHYYDLEAGGKIAKRAGWGYKEPSKAFPQLKNTVAVYAHLMDACYVNDEKVQAQEGDFYGGWITSNIVGPFKGGFGTFGW
ncbi:MAG: DUF427 domain-containing protein [Bacteroidota bacterium]